MRKRCLSCGFICFLTDESCKKCDSAELEIIPVSEFSSSTQTALKPLTLLSYFFYLVLSGLFEFALLLPVLMQLGSHGSSGSSGEKAFLILLFILHLPSIAICWLLSNLGNFDYVLLAPLLQVAFWFLLFIFIARKRRKKLR